MMLSIQLPRARLLWVFSAFLFVPGSVLGQGVTRAALNGIVTDQNGDPLPNANVVAVHEPTQTQYRAFVRAGGAYNIPNMRVGGPYTVTISLIGFEQQREENVHLSLAQTLRLDFQLARQVVELEALVVTPEQDEILNADRTGAATFIDPNQVLQLPSIKRSTRDLIRLDPRNDGNFSFGGRNWLYNNISLDGSYFNLENDEQAGPTNVDVQLEYASVDVAVGYRFLEVPVNDSQLELEAKLGTRWQYLSLDLDLTPGPPVNSQSRDWQELLVGCKAILKFNERASFAAAVDFSGFGIGSGSRLTWNLELIMRYMMTESTMLAVGYRLLDIDVSYGSAASRNNLDAQFSGPVLGVGFVF